MLDCYAIGRFVFFILKVPSYSEPPSQAVVLRSTMLIHRLNLERIGIGRPLVYVIVCAIGLFVSRCETFGQDPQSAIESPTEEQIDRWIHHLESDSYASRQLAIQLLQPHPTLALPAVERAIESLEEDAANRLIRLLGRWSTNPDEGYGALAYDALNRVAEGGVSARSSIAMGVIEAIRMTQSSRATDYLSHLSAFIGLEPDKLFAMNMRYEMLYVLRINEAFRGTIEDLDCVRWLSDVRVVRLIGPRIDRECLEQIVKIPNLRTLQIRNTSITSEDLKALYSLDRLEGLEILYTPIDDTSIEILGNLPLWGRLRLFGTRMSADGAEKLTKQLEGADVTFGLGGFLGIGSSLDGLVINQITPGSGAEQAGLRVEDRILTIQGKKIERFVELRAELAKYPPGAVVKVEFERKDSIDGLEGRKSTIATVDVMLGEQPDLP